MLQKRLGCAPKHHLAQARMHEGPHDDHIGLGQGGMIAQRLCHVAVQSRQIQDGRVDAMTREVRGDLGTWNGVFQLLLAGDADQLDLLGRPQEGHGVVELPRRLGAAVPRHHNACSGESLPARRNHDQGTLAVRQHSLDEPPVDRKSDGLCVQYRQIMHPGKGGEAPHQIRIGKLRRFRGAGQPRSHGRLPSRVRDGVRKGVESTVLGCHEPRGDLADEVMRQDELHRGSLNGHVGPGFPGQRKAVRQRGGGFLRIALLGEADQDTVDVLQHGVPL